VPVLARPLLDGELSAARDAPAFLFDINSCDRLCFCLQTTWPVKKIGQKTHGPYVLRLLAAARWRSEA
jgi:hypothetical protein